MSGLVSSWECVGTVDGHAPGPGCGAGGTGDARRVDLDAQAHTRKSKHTTVTSHRSRENR